MDVFGVKTSIIGLDEAGIFSILLFGGPKNAIWGLKTLVFGALFNRNQ